MSAGLALQYAVVALLVMASAGVVVRRQFPGFTRRARAACALPLLGADRPAWMRSIGKRIAPRPRAAANGCGGCDGCDAG